ncbi:MAG: PKD domain-containing protein, partial [Anaerolineales bacterium]|nr:PKD domain-containing protein [Anaerolineales bacterium]
EVTHQAPVTGVVVLEEELAPDPDWLVENPANTEIVWTHELTAGHTSQVDNLTLVLPDMQAGEVRRVANHTVISYTGHGGGSVLRLPPLYVTAQHLAAISPSSMTANPGGSAVFEISLSNPGLTETTISVDVAGLPESWIDLDNLVTLAAGEEVVVPMTVAIPAGAPLGETVFSIVVETESGSVDQAGASLVIENLLTSYLSPQLVSAYTGETVTLTLALYNHEPEARTYTLSVDGLEGNEVELVGSVLVEAGGVVSVPLQVTAYAAHGYHPFTISSVAYGIDSGPLRAANDAGSGWLARYDASGILEIIGDRRVSAELAPDEVVGGPGVTAVMTLTVMNTGALSDTYTFDVNAPAGWTVELQANDAVVDELTLSPFLFNSADLLLLVTPSTSTAAGSYNVSLVVQSQLNPVVNATVEAAVEVLNYGVGVNITPFSNVMAPDDEGVWQVEVTNHGSQADTYEFTAGGILAYSADFSPATLSLAPGESQNVQLTAGDLDYALPKTYAFWVAATSQYDERIQGAGDAMITFSGSEGVEVAWLPDQKTVTGTLSIFTLLITNTGNINTVFNLSASGLGLDIELEEDTIYIPPHMTAAIQVIVEGEGGGTYLLEGAAVAADEGASSTAFAELVIDMPALPPKVNAGPDQTLDEGDLVSFTGVVTGSAESYSPAWSFGDGVTLTGLLTPTHVYAEDGFYTVTLTVTDEFSQVVTDSLTVHVMNVAPMVNAGEDMVGFVGYPVAFYGMFTDPGVMDTHTIEWTFGDSEILTGTLTPTHTFAAGGSFTVTLTVTDDDSGIGSDQLKVTVNEGEEQADLTVNKTVTGTILPGRKALAVRQPHIEFNAGEQVVYTIEVENSGPVNATGILVQDMLPGGLTYDSDDGGGAYSPGSGEWLVGSLSVGLSNSLHITATINYGTGGLTITNTASVAAADQLDPVAGNNSSSAGFKVKGYRLYLPLIVRNS